MQSKELQKLYLNYKEKEATWQTVEYTDCERDDDEGIEPAGARSHTKKMIPINVDGVTHL
jgi:hypothetical protein